VETTRYKGEKIHIGCGGVVLRGRCIKCGEKQERKGLGERIFGKGPLVISEKDEETKTRQEHRDRIKEGRDIFK